MYVILALMPILVLLASLGFLKIASHKATTASLCLTSVIAVFAFEMKPLHLLQAAEEGAAFALLPILWVILSALFVYNTTLQSGKMDTIRDLLSGISPDRRVQILLISYAFGGFLEAVAGFGTAVAIPAAILIAMGFEPFQAAVLCLVANTIPVAFGVLGVPVVTLAQVTGLPLDQLSINTCLQLFPFAVILPFVLVILLTGRLGGIRGVTGMCLASGLAFAAGQTAAVMVAGPEIAAMTGSLLSMAVILGMAHRSRWNGVPDGEVGNGAGKFEEGRTRMPGLGEILLAWSPYLLILLFVGLTRFVPALSFLQQEPFTLKLQFYYGEGGKAISFPLVTTGGTLLFLSAVIGGLIQGLHLAELVRILGATVRQMKKTILTVLCIVALAKIMTYSGMVAIIATSFAGLTGGLYPLFAPAIGALGTFITGSDTSSNILFGNLQQETANQLGFRPEWIAAANASGATAGKMISPQSISIAAAATGLQKEEGRMLRFTIRYCLIYIALMGILTLVAA